MTLKDTSLKQIHSIMNDENAVLIYSGEFNQEIVKSMLSYTEGKLESSGIDDLVRKKIFNVMVEQLQNITKHQYTDEEKQVIQPCFILIEHENYYMNYGIYANGLIVETCSKRYLKEYSGMMLL